MTANAQRISAHLRALRIQLEAEEVIAVAGALDRRTAPQLLIFGAGNDSLFWHRFNNSGETHILEDQPYWIRCARRFENGINVHEVIYSWRRSSWRENLTTGARSAFRLPVTLARSRWDVILVDGPAGYAPDTPGRGESLLCAAQIASLGTDVFVHDIDRELEYAFAAALFKAYPHSRDVKRLRHFSQICPDQLTASSVEARVITVLQDCALLTAC